MKEKYANGATLLSSLFPSFTASLPPSSLFDDDNDDRHDEDNDNDDEANERQGKEKMQRLFFSELRE